jgi:HEAT repeat protein
VLSSPEIREIAVKTILAVLTLGALSAAAAEAQDQGRKVTRIHLRNGNCVEGHLLNETSKGWTLRILNGEIMVRRDQVDQVETFRFEERLPEPATRPAPPPALLLDVELLLDVMAKGTAALRDPESSSVKALANDAKGDSADAVRALGTLHPDDLEKATVAICESGDRSALTPAQELLESPRAGLRASGVRIIASLGGLARRSDYRTMAEDPDPLVRRWVVASLAEVDDITSFDLIGFRLTDPDASVRAAARIALFSLSSRHHTGDDLVRTLLEKLFLSEDDATTEILCAIGTCGNKEAWEPVSRYLHDRNAAIRAQAALALSRLAVPESGDLLLNRLELEHEYWPRIQLAGAVQALKLKKAVDPLLAWMEEDDQNIRMAAVRALRQITSQSFGMDRDRWVAWWQDAKPRE